jgi:uncharacterized protein
MAVNVVKNAEESAASGGLLAPLALWLPLSIGGAYIAVFTFNIQEHALSWQIPLLLLGTALGMLSAVIGNAMRKFARPHTMIVSGGLLEVFSQKVFWLIGPQLYGAVLGSVLGTLIADAAITNYFHGSKQPAVIAGVSQPPTPRQNPVTVPVSADAAPPAPIEHEFIGGTQSQTPAAQPVASVSPSFDCAQARTLVETLICGDSKLAADDSELAGAYRKAMAASTAVGPAAVDSLKSSERQFIVQRNQCTDAACVSQVYHDRLAQLAQVGADQAQESPPVATVALTPGYAAQRVGGPTVNARPPQVRAFIAQQSRTYNSAQTNARPH